MYLLSITWSEDSKQSRVYTVTLQTTAELPFHLHLQTPMNLKYTDTVLIPKDK